MKVLTSPITKIILILVGFLAAVEVVRDLSNGYSYYISQVAGGKLLGNWFIAGMLFSICVTLLGIGVGKSRGDTNPPWRRVDLALLIGLALGVEQQLVNSATSLYEVFGIVTNISLSLLLCSAICYLVAIGVLIEIIARTRDKKVTHTLYWVRFLRLHPLDEPIGVTMFLAGIVTTIAWFAFPIYVVRITGSWSSAYDPLLFITHWGIAGILCALTYVCAFLATATQRYAAANVEMLRTERFKSELITNVSHDIRTPVTSIISYVDLLGGLPIENPEFKEYLDVLDRKSARLKTLLDDLMDASKLTTGNVSVKLQNVNLSEIIGQIAGEFDDRFGDENLTLVIRQPDWPVLAQADSSHLWRVLENLFSNAAKYALPGTRVFAELSQTATASVLELKNLSNAPIDTPAETLTEQFIRGDRARHTDGNGLGLYIAKSLVETMGGEFTIRASGDLFEVKLQFPGPVAYEPGSKEATQRFEPSGFNLEGQTY